MIFLFADSCSSDSETEDLLEKSSLTEELSPETKEEIEKTENLNDEKLDEENPKISAHMFKDNDRTHPQPLEPLTLEVGENEQIVQFLGNKMEQVEEVIKKDLEKSPKGKGRRSKTKDLPLEMTKISSFSQDEEGSDTHIEVPSLECASPESRHLPPAPEDDMDQSSREKKLKRKILGQSSPEKKIRMENGTEGTSSGPQERTGDAAASEGPKTFKSEPPSEPENEGMPSLVAESSPAAQERSGDKPDCPAEEAVAVPLKEEEDAMPLIGPETLVCHEVDLDDLDEKEKAAVEDVVVESSGSPSPAASAPPALPPVAPPSFSAASPLALSQDESRSVRSESDITIEVDSVAEESQEGLCDREPANGFEASITLGSCGILVPEIESRVKGKDSRQKGLWIQMKVSILTTADLGGGGGGV